MIRTLVAMAAFILPLTAAAQSAPRLDISYQTIHQVPVELSSLDVYPVVGSEPAPILVFVHGGSWRTGDKSNAKTRSPMIPWFNDQGFAFVSINLRLMDDERSPGTTYREQVQDVAAAVDWVRKNAKVFGGDPKRIVLLGFSSGAHLVSLVGTDAQILGDVKMSPRDLAGVIAMDVSAYDIPRAIAEGCDQGWCMAEKNLTATFGADLKAQEAASPVQYLFEGRAYPQFLVVSAPSNGGRTQRLSQMQSGYFVDALNQVGADATHLHAKNDSHASLVMDLGAPKDEITALLAPILAKMVAQPDEISMPTGQ